jgi:hypothetical protein
LTFLFAHLSWGGKLMITSFSHLKAQKTFFRTLLSNPPPSKWNYIKGERFVIMSMEIDEHDDARIGSG